MPNKLMMMMLAVFALVACDTFANVDQDELDRQDRRVFRQLSGG